MVTRWRFANQPWLRDINRLENQKANGDIVGHWLRPSHQEASQATLESRRPAVRHRQVVADTRRPILCSWATAQADLPSVDSGGRFQG